MRKRFEQQIEIGQLLIKDTRIPIKFHDSMTELMAALKEIFVTPKYNEQVFAILEEAIITGKKQTGRHGMDLWQLFVLSQVRLCLNIGYNRLHYVANYDKLLRQIMGIEKGSQFAPIEVEYQNIYDNVTLLNDATVRQLNDVIVEFGHEVFKKKEQAVLRLKTDSFVVENTVHFPTDYNLLWDCARKCLDGISSFVEKYSEIDNWRKLQNWRYQLKGLMREVGKASSSGGKNKDKRLKQATSRYLLKANAFVKKLQIDINNFPILDSYDIDKYNEILHFMRLLIIHIDLVDRRIIKGEIIPHEEKMFSIFETYTEMINKGKKHPSVELGKKLTITTDQYNLIIDYKLMNEEQDREIVGELVNRILARFNVFSWSFDKGFWLKENKKLLQEYIPMVVMPKLGKRNQEEEEEETARIFKKLKNKHSAIESNINELEHRGLDRCPDKGFRNFSRYVALAVTAYNLKKIGRQLLIIERQKQLKQALQAA